VRFARGVFALEDTPPPSPFVIAKTKANAFFKNLTKSCRDFVNQLGSLEPISRKYKSMFSADKLSCDFDNSTNSQVLTFSVNGCSSSFQYGNITIKLRSVSERKIQLGATRVGAIVRALWHLGKNNIDPQLSPQNIWDFNHPETIEFDEYKKLMPSWLSNICFKNTPWIWRRIAKFELLPLEQYDSEWNEEEYNEWVKSLNVGTGESETLKHGNTANNGSAGSTNASSTSGGSTSGGSTSSANSDWVRSTGSTISQNDETKNDSA
jgi:hypothetical protein